MDQSPPVRDSSGPASMAERESRAGSETAGGGTASGGKVRLGDNPSRQLGPSIEDPDSKEHPECRYSSSTAKECSTNNGKYTCETIRRIFKSCPNTRPEKIYEKTTTDSGTDDTSPAKGGGFMGGWGDQKHPGAESVTRRPPGVTFVPPELGAFAGFTDGADELFSIFGMMEKHLRSFLEEATPIDKANTGTTPHVPAPHKDQSKTKSQTNASDVEQA